MQKIVITRELTWPNAPKVGQIGYITKESRRYTAEQSNPVTRIRFPGRKLGFHGRKPIYLWISNDAFEEVE